MARNADSWTAAGVLIACVLGLAGCGEKAPPTARPDGEEKSITSRALESGADALQAKGAMEAFNTYLDGFHFTSGDLSDQMEAHHYCAKINEDLMQCVLFDADARNALLIGVEYIISEKLFNTLPDEERTLWHSHVYEVKSAQLIGPGLPEVAEHELMAQAVHTYGKTWHTWETLRSKTALPLGLPRLMMGFTGDGQLRPDLLQQRDERLGVSTQTKRRARMHLPSPPVAPGADAWMNGQAVVLRSEQKAMENIR